MKQQIKIIITLLTVLFWGEVVVGQCVTRHYASDNIGANIPLIGSGGQDCNSPTIASLLVGEQGVVNQDAIIEAVYINIAHSFVADLDITLIAPSGASILLSADNGGAGSNYSNTSFRDGFLPISQGVAPFSGAFQAQEGKLNDLLAGEDVNGQWQLSICDDTSGDVGQLLDFELQLCLGSLNPIGCLRYDGDRAGEELEAEAGADCFESTVDVLQFGTIGIDASISQVALDIAHTYTGDLVLTLISPTGTSLILSENNGSFGDNYTNTIFEADGADITSACAPFTNTYIPEGGTFDDVFAGEQINGEWTLEICDLYDFDTGVLNQFELEICAEMNCEIPVASIVYNDMPEYCQGYGILTTSIPNYTSLAQPVIYEWSTGQTTDEIVAPDNGIYSVTITTGDGCQTEATYEVDIDEVSTMSTYSLITNELYFLNSIVESGGILANGNAANKVQVLDNSSINTFLTAQYLDIDAASNVDVWHQENQYFSFPYIFVSPGFAQVTVPDNTTMTLTGNKYNKITVGKNATVILDNPNIKVWNFITKRGATVEFTGETTLQIKTTFSINWENTFNPTNEPVIVYGGSIAHIGEGSTFNVKFFKTSTLNISASAGINSSTFLNGLFVANSFNTSSVNVVLNQNLGCSSQDISAYAGVGNEVDAPYKTAPNLHEVSISPNPSMGEVTIDVSPYIDRQLTIVMYNALGEIVWQKEIDEVGDPILSENLSAVTTNGVYYLSFVSTNGIETKTIVIKK